MDKYAVILNPMAGRGKGGRLEDQLKRLLEEKLGKYRFFRTEYKGHAKEIANTIKDDYSTIIVAGGDGTIHEVVNGMMNGKSALGVIPIGSGNDFVKMLHIPCDMKSAIDIIDRAQFTRIDIGKVGDMYFPNGVGIGFDALVVMESSKIKRLRGFIIYLFSVLKTVFKYKNELVTFSANGTIEDKEIFLIAVGNGRAMGGGFYLNPNAEIDDGKFDVCVINALNKNDVFTNLPKALKGNHHQLKQVQMLRTNQLEITSQNGIAVHADGELLGTNLKKIDISIIPQALQVIHNPIRQEMSRNG